MHTILGIIMIVMSIFLLIIRLQKIFQTRSDFLVNTLVIIVYLGLLVGGIILLVN